MIRRYSREEFMRETARQLNNEPKEPVDWGDREEVERYRGEWEERYSHINWKGD